MDADWLKSQLELHPGRSKADLARALGLEPPAISKILSGRRQIKANEYVAMRAFFGLPSDGGRAAQPGGSDRSYVIEPLDPALREMGTGEGEQEPWIMPASLFENRTRAAPGKIRIFAVHGDAMAPDFMPGEQVLVDLSDRTPSPAGVFVLSDGLGYNIRQCEYVPHSNPPAVRIAARNARYQPYEAALEKADLTGRVIAKLQWV